MSAAVLRDAAAIAGALGVLLLLVPLPGPVPALRRRVAGLALVLAAWAALVASLATGDDLEALRERVSAPLAGAGAAVALVVGVAALVLLTRAVVARPGLWFLLLGLALPVRVPVALAGGEQAKLLLPLYGVIVVGVAAAVVRRRRGPAAAAAGSGPRTPVDVPLALFVALTLLSTLWSADPPEAAVRGAFFYLPFTLLLLVVVDLWPGTRALRALVLTTLGVGAGVAVLALAQYATGTIWWNATLQQANVYSRFFRVNGIFYDPNILGRFLAVGIVAALAVALYRRRPAELIALGAVVALLTAGLVVTFSRSSALMLMTAAALLAVRAVGPRRALAVGGTLLVLGAAAALAGNDNVRRAATSTERLERVSEGRFDLMRGGLRIWREEPVLGVGLGGFGTRFSEGLTPVEQRRVRVVVSHNAPITVLSETGLAGLALMVALGVTAAVRLGRGARDDGAAGWARWAALATLAGIVVHSLFYAALFEDPYTWVLAGVSAALLSPPPAPPRPAAPEAAEAVAVT